MAEHIPGAVGYVGHFRTLCCNTQAENKQKGKSKQHSFQNLKPYGSRVKQPYTPNQQQDKITQEKRKVRRRSYLKRFYFKHCSQDCRVGK